MAKPKAADEGQVKARVLCAGQFGAVNDVVVVDKAVAEANGDLDPHPDAVAYAESIAAPAADDKVIE
ncbi:hypothetical protein [Variovorax sp. GT1P44]|uniref:hypothetical protein n=1 Tax=Variovorax sp. GT1P44 TaxID=3443742 RepID=UPI003F4637E1